MKLAALCAVPAAALAGGPTFVTSSGNAFVWDVSSNAIAYRTDGGNLSTGINNATAQARVRTLFDVWQDVPTSNIRYARAGQIQAVTGFSDGDVNTAEEFDAVEGDCFDGNQSPIVFDVDGSMFEDLGQDPSVIGFAGPCAGNGAGKIVSGRAVMNGIFLDGIENANNPELTPAEFDAAFIHEFGHFSGLDHSQVNVNCLSGCGADDLAGLPTMFPFLMSSQQRTLAPDDVAWISFLYPQSGTGGFNATHGVIRGVVYFSDGQSHAQFVNVVARRVDDGDNEDRRFAGSSVSGYRFRLFHGNPITNAAPSSAGSDNPAHIGLYEIPVAAGSYTVEVESIDPEFVDGSRVGPGLVVPLPGDAPAPIGPFTVNAGQSSNGHDVVLIDTAPRYDDFETDP
ncbi:MAG TPA: hypothetical protein VFM30_11475 [Steroidobacteraceae bacterium]|nr:hypothetical protein [Steroidobacteraceae bacterium]